MIEALTGFPPKVLAFACKGHVTKADYETVLIPAAEEAFQKQAKVRVYYQVDHDFSGFDPGAMWDDFKLGMEHILGWERIAVVTDLEWMRLSVRAFSFLMHGAVKVFHLAEADKARDWILADLTA